MSNTEIKNGFLSEFDVTYDLNRKTEFRCKQGYVTANGETSGTVTCLQNGWSAQPSCFSEYLIILLPLYWRYIRV